MLFVVNPRLIYGAKHT